MTACARPALGERIPCGTLHVLDTSDLRGSYLLDCESGVQIRLSPRAYRVLSAVWSGKSFEQVADESGDADRRLSPVEVAHVYDRVIARVTAAEQRRSRRGLEQGFLLRATVVPAALAGYLSAPFAVLFGPVSAVPATALIVGAAVYWAATQRVPPPVRGDEFAVGCGLFVLSCLAHELGHAGACARFGVRPGSIGVALYLMFPVFYTDVTRIWRLRRRQRVVVDIGGSYVQCLCGACYVLAYAHTNAAAFFVATNLIVVTTLLNMNPLFRFDGYWLLSDALGVSGLMKHAGGFFGRMLAPRMARKDARAPHLPGYILVAISIYSVAALAGWAWFVARLAVYVLEQGRRLLAAWPALAAHREPFTFALAGQLGAALAGCLALGFCVFKVLRFVRRTTARS